MYDQIRKKITRNMLQVETIQLTPLDTPYIKINQ